MHLSSTCFNLVGTEPQMQGPKSASDMQNASKLGTDQNQQILDFEWFSFLNWQGSTNWMQYFVIQSKGWQPVPFRNTWAQGSQRILALRPILFDRIPI